MLTDAMNLFDLTITQLKRAAAIKEQIEALNNELRSILSGAANSSAASKKKLTASVSRRKSVATRPATRSAKPVAKLKKSTMSSATRAKLSAKLKAYWAAKRAGKK
jgi:cobalamin-dependent methionine synthase I